jgi:hypothetical protein
VLFCHLTIIDSVIICIIYPNELEVKDTTYMYTDPEKSASYLDLHLEIDNGCRSKTKPYDRNDDFTFPIVNFPFQADE